MLRNLVVPCMLDPLPGREVEVDEFQVAPCRACCGKRRTDLCCLTLVEAVLICKHRLPWHVLWMQVCMA